MKIDTHFRGMPVLGPEWGHDYPDGLQMLIDDVGDELHVKIPNEDGELFQVRVSEGMVQVNSSWNEGETVIEIPDMVPMWGTGRITGETEPEQKRFFYYVEQNGIEIEDMRDKLRVALPVAFDNVAFGEDWGGLDIVAEVDGRYSDGQWKWYVEVDPQTREVRVVQE